MAELDLTNIAATSIATPGSGVTALFADSINKSLKQRNDAGFVTGLPILNFSVTSQSISAATRTYLTGSAITVPLSKLQIGTILRWRFDMTKTNAGSATSTIDVCFGTNGTTADTARVSFTKPAGTAVPDEAWCEIECIVRGPLSGSGVVVGTFQMTHNLAATGHAQIPVVVVNTVSSGFDVTVANLIVGVCLTSGASDAITIQQVTAEALNL
jgi:hypothetical protein